MAITLLGATALVPGAQSLLHSVQQFSLQTICTENKMGNQGVGFLHYVGNINNSLNVNQFLDIDKPFWVWAFRITSRPTTQPRVPHTKMTNIPGAAARGVERTLFVKPNSNFILPFQTRFLCPDVLYRDEVRYCIPSQAHS